MKRISLGFSPCPNDTFIFYALLNGLLGQNGPSFDPHIEDVQKLNEMAIERELDVSKLSFAAFGHLLDDYVLLNSGAAVARDSGPLIIAKEPLKKKDLPDKRMASPGEFTTANLLLKLYCPALDKPIQMRFDEIIPSILSGRIDAGVIIHESRFIFAEKGLFQVADLGEWWQDETGLPLPLGAIFAKKSLGREMIRTIERLIKMSLEFALADPDGPMDYVRRYAGELHDEVIKSHIALYVNDFSLNLKGEGTRAVSRLLEMGSKAGLFPRCSGDFMLD